MTRKSPSIVTLRVVTLSPPGAESREPRFTRRQSRPDPNRRPAKDWTGHEYKAPAECGVDYTRAGWNVMRGGEQWRRELPNASIM